jgi:hypothetical protein
MVVDIESFASWSRTLHILLRLHNARQGRSAGFLCAGVWTEWGAVSATGPTAKYAYIRFPCPPLQPTNPFGSVRGLIASETEDSINAPVAKGSDRVTVLCRMEAFRGSPFASSVVDIQNPQSLDVHGHEGQACVKGSEGVRSFVPLCGLDIDQTRTSSQLSFANRSRDLSPSGVATFPLLCVRPVDRVRSSLVPYPL